MYHDLKQVDMKFFFGTLSSAQFCLHIIDIVLLREKAKVDETENNFKIVET